MDRAIIDWLTVWDPDAGRFVTLQPGTLLRSCRILPSQSIGPHGPRAPYAAEFEAEGRTYRCPLYGFLPRTRVLEAETPAEIRRPETLTA